MTSRRAGSGFLTLVAILSACGGGSQDEQTASAQHAQHAQEAQAPGQEQTGAPGATPAPGEAPAPEGSAPLAKATVTLYFPAAEGEGLVAEQREIVDTKAPADRGAQIVAALLEGPLTDAALPAVPKGTTLRRLWVRDDGDAFADFSEELASPAAEGGGDELLTVYSIVDSLTSNVPGIRRVGILVAGRERDTLGHLDLRRPLPPDPKLIAGAASATE